MGHTLSGRRNSGLDARRARPARALLCGAALGLLLDAAAVAGASVEAAAQEVGANFNHEMTGSVVDDAVKQMAEALAERSDGRIDITVHSRGEMGGERAMYHLMQAGAIELGVSGAARSGRFQEYSA